MLKFNSDTIDNVRKTYELDKPGRIDEAVKLLSEWAKKQNHFVKKDFSAQFLERMIIAAKGSVERAKTRLDTICTVKTLMPHFFGDYNPKEEFEYLTGKIAHVTLPKMTPDHDRILVAKYEGKKFTSKMIFDGFRIGVMHAEYLRAFDYATAYQIVIDFRGANVADFLTNINILDLRQAAVIVIDGYGVRVKGIHLLTESKFISALISIGKQVLSEKISSRITVHKDLDALYKVVPKDILASDFGGSEKSVKDLNDDWLDVLSSKDFRTYWKEMSKACTEESKRQSHKFQEQYMGMPGSFRKLNVD